MLISQTPIGRDGWSRRDLSKCALMSALGRKQTLGRVPTDLEVVEGPRQF
jgi:hypothetical protein